MADTATSPEPSDNSDAGTAPQPVRSWSVWLPTGGFYAGGCGLAWLSHLAGESTISPTAAVIVILLIVTTNALLAVLTPRDADEQPAGALTAAQSGLAIAWTSVYAVLLDGSGELLPGMYLTAVLLAVLQAGSDRVQQLALAAGGSYALVILVRALTSTAGSAAWGELLQCAGVIVMLSLLSVHARRAEDRRRELTDNVARLKYEMHRVSRSAERDHLTKSFNRQYIMEALLREKARADRSGRGFSICIFDLDRFKSLNDRHGHLAGDRVLTVFATRARRALRAMDAINPTRFRRSLGRMGGEEFIAVLPGTGLEGALRCAERVREVVGGQPVDQRFRMTVSAGVAEYQHGESITELLTRADQALYEAKRGGRNRVRISTPQPRNDTAPKPTLRIVR